MAHPGIDVIRDLLGDSRKLPTTLLERRANLTTTAGSPPAPEGVSVEAITLADRPAERLTPGGATRDVAILYLHGGGYCAGSPDTHRGIAGALALAAGAAVVTLDYRLAPEDPFPQRSTARSSPSTSSHRPAWPSPATRRAAASPPPRRSRCETGAGPARRRCG